MHNATQGWQGRAGGWLTGVVVVHFSVCLQLRVGVEQHIDARNRLEVAGMGSGQSASLAASSAHLGNGAESLGNGAESSAHIGNSAASESLGNTVDTLNTVDVSGGLRTSLEGMTLSATAAEGSGSVKSEQLQHYDVLRKLGRGSYGVVFLVRDRRDSQFYCLKQIFIDSAPTESERHSAELEVETLRSLDHPSIVRYHEHFVHQDSLCLVMTYCEGGDLSQLIKKHSQERVHFTESQILEWFVQMAMALHHVHSKKVLHRDLKSQNIFLSKNFVKVGDFGVVKLLDGSITSAHTAVGTPYYLSPEVCQGHKYSYKSDVWALGCILYELCALQQVREPHGAQARRMEPTC
eukprot:4561283-Prymnesium_polylepis.1